MTGLAAASCLLFWSPLAAEDAKRVVPESMVQVKQSFAPVVKRVAPAVVNVYVSRKVAQVVSPFANDPFFSRLFGDNFGIPRERVQNSLGSGVLVAAEGVADDDGVVTRGVQTARQGNRRRPHSGGSRRRLLACPTTTRRPLRLSRQP